MVYTAWLVVITLGAVGFAFLCTPDLDGLNDGFFYRVAIAYLMFTAGVWWLERLWVLLGLAPPYS